MAVHHAGRSERKWIERRCDIALVVTAQAQVDRDEVRPRLADRPHGGGDDGWRTLRRGRIVENPRVGGKLAVLFPAQHCARESYPLMLGRRMELAVALFGAVPHQRGRVGAHLRRVGEECEAQRAARGRHRLERPGVKLAQHRLAFGMRHEAQQCDAGWLCA